MLMLPWRLIVFLWVATRGHRLRPWRSPYLRWRLETYSGLQAETLQLGDFWRVFVADYRQFGRFLLWMAQMHALARKPGEPL